RSLPRVGRSREPREGRGCLRRGARGGGRPALGGGDHRGWGSAGRAGGRARRAGPRGAGALARTRARCRKEHGGARRLRAQLPHGRDAGGPPRGDGRRGPDRGRRRGRRPGRRLGAEGVAGAAGLARAAGGRPPGAPDRAGPRGRAAACRPGTTPAGAFRRPVARPARGALSLTPRPGPSCMTVRELALFLAFLPVAIGLWAYVGYPLALWLLTRAGGRKVATGDPAVWPTVSFSLPAHNEERNIRATLDALIAIEYPRDRVQIVVGSDASTDRTDEIVGEYADRGVELVRLDLRGGKTAVENGLVPYLKGDLVVNTDATIRILPGSLKPLVRAFQDPSVGVASGRDV